MPAITPSEFFKQKRSASEIKSEILNSYFKTWAAILLRGQQYKSIDYLMYIDLFSGPGVYDDGKPSTPIKILDSIYNSKDSYINFNEHIQTVFNDKDEELVKRLDENIKNLSYYNELKYKPVIGNEEASQSILERLKDGKTPSLTFIDPLGYGYTQEMLLYSVKSWGSDLFVLFNLNRIRSAVQNYKVEKNMYGIFTDYFSSIKEFYSKEESPVEREKFIVQIFEKIFEDKGYMTMKFKVNFPDKNQTSHYLFFISKVKIAITRAKEIMQKYSDYQQDGVPNFTANTKKSSQVEFFMPELFEFSIEGLKTHIIESKNQYDGYTIGSLYEEHHYKTNYIKENYKEAIKQLKEQNKLTLFDKNNNATNRITYTAKIKFI